MPTRMLIRKMVKVSVPSGPLAKGKEVRLDSVIFAIEDVRVLQTLKKLVETRMLERISERNVDVPVRQEQVETVSQVRQLIMSDTREEQERFLLKVKVRSSMNEEVVMEAGCFRQLWWLWQSGQSST